MSSDKPPEMQLRHVDIDPWVELLNSPEDRDMVIERIENIIFTSFVFLDAKLYGQRPKITEEQVKERFLICQKWFRVMRGDCGYGQIKTLDLMAKALACDLLKIPFDPKSDRSAKGSERSWVPQDIDELLKKLPAGS